MRFSLALCRPTLATSRDYIVLGRGINRCEFEGNCSEIRHKRSDITPVVALKFRAGMPCQERRHTRDGLTLPFRSLRRRRLARELKFAEVRLVYAIPTSLRADVNAEEKRRRSARPVLRRYRIAVRTYRKRGRIPLATGEMIRKISGRARDTPWLRVPRLSR